jgi:hypothetical protein
MKKLFGLCLVFLFLGAGFAFSLNLINSAQMRCTRLVVDGQDHTRNVRSVLLNIFSDNSTMIVFTFHNGRVTEYHFTNQRQTSHGTITSDTVIRSNGQRFTNLYTISAESAGILTFTVYDRFDNSRIGEITLRTM